MCIAASARKRRESDCSQLPRFRRGFDAHRPYQLSSSLVRTCKFPEWAEVGNKSGKRMFSRRLIGSEILRDRRQADKANNKHEKCSRRFLWRPQAGRSRSRQSVAPSVRVNGSDALRDSPLAALSIAKMLSGWNAFEISDIQDIQLSRPNPAMRM
jgi:hypothetical protein